MAPGTAIKEVEFVPNSWSSPTKTLLLVKTGSWSFVRCNQRLEHGFTRGHKGRDEILRYILEVRQIRAMNANAEVRVVC